MHHDHDIKDRLARRIDASTKKLESQPYCDSERLKVVEQLARDAGQLAVLNSKSHSLIDHLKNAIRR